LVPNTNITTKELVPIVLATVIWGQSWATIHVLVRSDNWAVVEILRTRSSHDSEVMHLLWCLHFFCARHSIRLSARHIPGIDNAAADALSRGKLQEFPSVSPGTASSYTSLTATVRAGGGGAARLAVTQLEVQAE